MKTTSRSKFSSAGFAIPISIRSATSEANLGGLTYGGYSESIVVDERFVLRVPPNLDPAGVAPLLCAGITTYSPICRQGVGKGKKVGVPATRAR